MPQAILAVCVRRTSISVQVLPFGLSLSPRVFTKVAEAALVPLREQGVRILNYLDDWLSLRISYANTGIGALAPQHCDRCVHQPTRWSTLPSHVATRPPPPPLESEASEVASRHSYSGLAQPDSRRAVTSCAPRRMETPSPDGPADLRRFGLAQVDLFASLETSHCQLFYSLTEGTLSTDALAHSWPRGLRKYAFPPVSLLAQTLCKVREEEEQILLVAPYWPTRTWFPELMLLVTAPPWQIPLRKDLLTQRRGTLWHLRPDLWKLHVWSLDGTRRF